MACIMSPNIHWFVHRNVGWYFIDDTNQNRATCQNTERTIFHYRDISKKTSRSRYTILSHRRLAVVYELWNSSVFNLFRKICRDWDAVTDGGRLFQVRSAAINRRGAVTNGAAQRRVDDQFMQDSAPCSASRAKATWNDLRNLTLQWKRLWQHCSSHKTRWGPAYFQLNAC